MPTAASDLEWRLSGGAANTDPNASLGGAISTAGGGLIADAVDNNLFDDVSSAETTAGDTEYRGLYLKNVHATITMQDIRVFFTTAADDLDIALPSEAVNTSIATIANESTAPVGPTFSHPTTYAGGLALNSTTGLTAGSYRGLWVRRVVPAAAPGEAAHTETLKAQWDSL